MKRACLTFAALLLLSGAVFAQETLKVVPPVGDTTKREAQMLYRPFGGKTGLWSASGCGGWAQFRAQVERVAVLCEIQMGETSLDLEAPRKDMSKWPLGPGAGLTPVNDDFIEVFLDCAAGIAERAVRFEYYGGVG